MVYISSSIWEKGGVYPLRGNQSIPDLLIVVLEKGIFIECLQNLPENY